MFGHLLHGDLDNVNKNAYRRPGVLRQYGSASGWLEPGEKAAVLSVAGAARGLPILDIGVGGGRTTPLMCGISTDYVGIDYVPEMVGLARHRFPDADIREMNARYLDFPDGLFALATFSYNGIDSVNLSCRHAILNEIQRVLRPGGYFVFSSLNRDAASGLPHWPDWRVFEGTRLQPRRLLRATAKLLVGGVNRIRGSLLEHDDGDVSIGNLSAHNFALVVLFTAPAAEARELHDAGFILDAIFKPDGSQVPLDCSSGCGAPWHHFVARKAGGRVVACTGPDCATGHNKGEFAVSALTNAATTSPAMTATRPIRT